VLSLTGFFRYYTLRRRLRALGIMPPLFAGLRRRELWPAPARSWGLTILAEIDEKHCLISPTVLIAGTPLSEGRVVIELLGEDGPVGLPVKAPLTVEERSSMLILPAISLPEGAIGAVSSWCWSVRLESKHGRVLARWSKRLTSAGALNCEAELDL